MAKLERYHKNPNMWEYMRKTRIPVDNIFELLERENRGVDKVQALFSDMEERQAALRELEREPGLELVGSLKYNIEINAAGVNKGTGLLNLGRQLVSGVRKSWHAVTGIMTRSCSVSRIRRCHGKCRRTGERGGGLYRADQ